MALPDFIRIFRFTDKDGHAQISDFPDSPPVGDTDLEIRNVHFTEIETIAFFAFILAHELKGPARSFGDQVSNLQVPDPLLQSQLATLQSLSLTDEEVGDTLTFFGLNWEHFIASTNSQLIPKHAKKMTDTLFQEKIDSLESIVEALVAEINFRSANPL
jgi:hypothetical protein